MTNRSFVCRFSQLRLPARFLLVPVITFPDARPPARFLLVPVITFPDEQPPARFLLLPVITFPDERPPIEIAFVVKHLRHNFALMVWHLALWQTLHVGRLGLAFFVTSLHGGRLGLAMGVEPYVKIN